jgi:hypothetical protein
MAARSFDRRLSLPTSPPPRKLSLTPVHATMMVAPTPRSASSKSVASNDSRELPECRACAASEPAPAASRPPVGVPRGRGIRSSHPLRPLFRSPGWGFRLPPALPPQRPLSLTPLGEPLNGSLTPEVPSLKGSRTVRFQARERFVCACTLLAMKGSFPRLSNAGQTSGLLRACRAASEPVGLSTSATPRRTPKGGIQAPQRQHRHERRPRERPERGTGTG